MAAFALAFVTAPAQAGITLFTGADDGAGSLATAPHSTAAAATFDAAVGTLGIENTITFESTSLGSFTSLALPSGVMLTGTNINSNDQSIVNTTSNINITHLVLTRHAVTTQLREDHSFYCCLAELQPLPSAWVRMHSAPT